jgi:uncharacterized protein (DUF2267 family)
VTDLTLPVFDQTLRKTNAWLNAVTDALGSGDRHRAYQALRGPNEAAQLGAQLPLLLRGTYYEGWHPAGKPLKERNREHFLDHVRADITQGDAEDVVRAVFEVIGQFISAGEIDDIVWMLPEGVRDLWPEAITST